MIRFIGTCLPLLVGEGLLMSKYHWSSGIGRRPTLWRLWVRIPVPYTGWKFFHINLLKNCVDVCLKKTKNKQKRGRVGPFKKVYELRISRSDAFNLQKDTNVDKTPSLDCLPTPVCLWPVLTFFHIEGFEPVTHILLSYKGLTIMKQDILLLISIVQ